MTVGGASAAISSAALVPTSFIAVGSNDKEMRKRLVPKQVAKHEDRGMVRCVQVLDDQNGGPRTE